MIKLPKEFLSHSQYNLWNTNKDKYVEHYMRGNKTNLDTPQINFGKDIADRLEFTGKTGIDSIDSKLIQYDTRDVSMFANVGPIHCLYKCDGYDSTTGNFVEYKTGSFPWTQDLVDKSTQLKFYASCIYAFKGIVSKVHLQWMPTIIKNGKLELTGEIVTFERIFTIDEIILFSGKIVHTGKAISIAFADFNARKGLDDKALLAQEVHLSINLENTLTII